MMTDAAKTLCLIVRHIDRYGVSPTYREIAQDFNNSLRKADNMVNTLLDLKAIGIHPNEHRGIYLTEKGAKMAKNPDLARMFIKLANEAA